MVAAGESGDDALLLGLDAFSRCLDAERLCERHDGNEDRARLCIRREIADKRAIDLDTADGKAAQAAQRRLTDAEIVAGIHLLARSEGIFTEPAGGTTVAVTKKLIELGRIPRNESIVISVTGNGYKTLEAVTATVANPFVINARLQEFDALYDQLAPHTRRAVGGA